MAAYSEKSKAYSIKYAKEKLKRVPLDLPLAGYDELKQVAEQAGESVNGFIKLAISDRIEKLNQEQKQINQNREVNQTK